MDNQLISSAREKGTIRTFLKDYSVPECLGHEEKNKTKGIYIHLSGNVGPWIKKLCDFPNLKMLSFSRCKGNQSDQWDELKKLKTLQSLEIHDCTPLNQSALESIAELKNLRRLHITSQNIESRRDLSVLGKLYSLQTLELGIEQILDDYVGLWAHELDFISELPALEHLLLRDNCHLCATELKIPPKLKVLSVPSYTLDYTISHFRKSGVIIMGAWQL